MLGYKVALFPYFSVAFAKDTQDKVNLKNVFNIGAILVLLGLFLYMINGGYSLKQLFIGGVSESVELTSSFLSGYGKQMINFCIPGCCLMLIAYLQEKHSIYNRVLLVAAVTLSLSSFMIAGFRYRIIYLLMAFFTIYYIQNRKNLIWHCGDCYLSFLCFLWELSEPRETIIKDLILHNYKIRQLAN